MFDSIRRPLLAAIVAAEEQKLVDNTDTSFSTDIDEFKNGSMVIRVLPSRTAFKNIVTNSKVIVHRDSLISNLPVYAWAELFQDVTTNIRTLDIKVKFTDAINIVNDLYNNLGNKLYGVLLINQDETIRINPLHPLTAMRMAAYPGEDLWTIAIYTYTDKQKLDIYYDSDMADLSLINENIKDQLNLYINRYSSSEVNIISKAYNRETRRIELQYKVKQHQDEDDYREVNLVTHQILAAGTIAPYYGTSIIQKKFKGQQVSGMPLTPMMSSNISSTISLNHFTYSIPPSKVTLEYSSVCTGTSYSNTTMEGLRTLAHSNTASAYISKIIQAGALPYVSACIAKSIEIYKLTKIIKKG